MKEYVWKRRVLPDGHTPHSLYWGWLLIVFGGIGILCGADYPTTTRSLYGRETVDIEAMAAASLLTTVSSAMFGFGIILLLLGAIVTELRRAAFEAAYRAGEVEIVEVESNIRPAEPLESESVDEDKG